MIKLLVVTSRQTNLTFNDNDSNVNLYIELTFSIITEEYGIFFFFFMQPFYDSITNGKYVSLKVIFIADNLYWPGRAIIAFARMKKYYCNFPRISADNLALRVTTSLCSKTLFLFLFFFVVNNVIDRTQVQIILFFYSSSQEHIPSFNFFLDYVWFFHVKCSKHNQK